jgi:hypothetical protein
VRKVDLETIQEFDTKGLFHSIVTNLEEGDAFYWNLHRDIGMLTVWYLYGCADSYVGPSKLEFITDGNWESYADRKYWRICGMFDPDFVIERSVEMPPYVPHCFK